MTSKVIYPTGLNYEIYPTEEDKARDTITIVFNYQPETAMVLKLKKNEVEDLIAKLSAAIKD